MLNEKTGQILISPVNALEEDQKMKQRSNQIFKNIFQEVFLANCGNSIDFEQVSYAFRKHLGDALTHDRLKHLERLFYMADLDNVSAF